MHWTRRVLQLFVEPAAPTAPRTRRCPRRAGARRPRIVPLERGARAARRDGSPRTAGPSTDDPRARRRELVELGRLAVAFAMRDALAR